MRQQRQWRTVRWFAALMVLLFAAVGCAGGEETSTSENANAAEADEPKGAAGSDDAAAFYEGKQVRLIVPYDPGGGFDTYARGLAPYLAEQLGADVVVENVPGAGGLIGANQTFTANPDGLTIGLINYPGAIFAELTGQDGAQFDNTQWQVLGRVAAVNPLVYTSAQSDLDRAEAVIESSDEVVFGLGGVGSDSYYGTIAIAETLGFPYKLVTGYSGSGEADSALVAGEVEAGFNSLDSAMAFVESGDAQAVMYVGTERAEALPDTPTIVELADGDDAEVMRALASIYDLERILVTASDVPNERVAELRAAVIAALEDEGFQQDMEEAGRSLNILDGDAAQERVSNVGGQVDRLRPLLENA